MNEGVVCSNGGEDGGKEAGGSVGESLIRGCEGDTQGEECV